MEPESLKRLEILPDEMLKFVLDSTNGLRLGRLLSQSRPPIHVPHYVAVTSRGIVPHIAQDIFEKHTQISAVYTGLEDFTEKSSTEAPIYKTSTSSLENADQSRLRTYTSLPSQALTILGARRVPRIACPAQNTDDGISISTSVGFRTLKVEDYEDAVQNLGAEISVSLPDLIDKDVISIKRIEKSVDRVHAWWRDLISSIETYEDRTDRCTFASVMPYEAEVQNLYLSDLISEYHDKIHGLCLYDSQTATILPSGLEHLPRLCVSDPSTPHDLLHSISLGIDFITVPFVTSVSEQGLAFNFTFPAPNPNNSNQQHSRSSEPSTDPSTTNGSINQTRPLATDLFTPIHASSLLPLTPNCTCYTCTHHHSAYIHHLLTTREMLAWTLLQIHNFHVLHLFFEGVRRSIALGKFELEKRAFEEWYDRTWPVGVGELGKEGERGPRRRGYERKSVGRGGDKRRERVWGRFEEREKEGGDGTGGGREKRKKEKKMAMTMEDEGIGEGERENDMRVKVEEAESGGLTPIEGEGNGDREVLLADEIERMGLAEYEERLGRKDEHEKK